MTEFHLLAGFLCEETNPVESISQVQNYLDEDSSNDLTYVSERKTSLG